jgi:hypothetical protein
MNRQEAIDHILGLSGSVTGEYCINAREAEKLYQETAAALEALGVNPDELEANR